MGVDVIVYDVFGARIPEEKVPSIMKRISNTTEDINSIWNEKIKDTNYTISVYRERDCNDPSIDHYEHYIELKKFGMAIVRGRDETTEIVPPSEEEITKFKEYLSTVDIDLKYSQYLVCDVF